jgi:hypothetical protein
VEDASVAKNDEQGAKKKRRKKKGSKKEEKCLTRVAYPLGNDFDSGAALSINSDQILTEFGNIAREFLRVRQKLADDILTDDTVQDIKLLQNVINKEDSVLSTFLDTICMLKSANLDIETEITNIAQKLQDFTLPGAQPMQTGEEGPVPISPPATRRGGLFDMSHSGEGDYVFGSGEGEDGEGKFVFASHVARSTRRKNRSQKQSKRRNTGGHRRRPKRRSSSSYSIVYV